MNTDFKDTNWFKIFLTNIILKTLIYNSKNPAMGFFSGAKKPALRKPVLNCSKRDTYKFSIIPAIP